MERRCPLWAPSSSHSACSSKAYPRTLRFACARCRAQLSSTRRPYRCSRLRPRRAAKRPQCLRSAWGESSRRLRRSGSRWRSSAAASAAWKRCLRRAITRPRCLRSVWGESPRRWRLSGSPWESSAAALGALRRSTTPRSARLGERRSRWPAWVAAWRKAAWPRRGSSPAWRESNPIAQPRLQAKLPLSWIVRGEPPQQRRASGSLWTNLAAASAILKPSMMPHLLRPGERRSR
mmetsp:Transcript_23136/g.66386  ORF Transcript_23136/g.66386 Transcript_23136/m.66386 type:complete len:234 (-) Transcript_23136:572-1273(-)